MQMQQRVRSGFLLEGADLGSFILKGSTLGATLQDDLPLGKLFQIPGHMHDVEISLLCREQGLDLCGGCLHGSTFRERKHHCTQF